MALEQGLFLQRLSAEEDMEMSRTTGRCLCGAIQYEYAGAPEEVIHCHCESCRRQTSSPVATFVMVKASRLTFTRGQPKEFGSSPGVWRSFCGECGSPIFYRSDRRPEIVDLYLGTLNDPNVVAPRCHVHAGEQLAWFEILDELPRFEGSRRGASPIRHGPRKA
jgi:hypothetical protein